jgi:hypothetical protein
MRFWVCAKLSMGAVSLAHRWHSFKVVLDTAIGPSDLKLNYELEEPVWLTLGEALETALTYPVRYVIERHRGELEG